jgi:hypothetical protein
MPTEKQIQAARQNGAKSKGPKTPEGKQRSSQNATLHGMLAETVVLKNEDKAEFQLLLDAYMDQYQPIGPTETHLVQQIVSCEWRQHRSWAMEAALFDDEMTRLEPKLEKEYITIDEPTRAANAWKSLSDSSNSLRLLTRYEASLHRRYLRAIKTLTELQNARKAAAPAEPAPAAPEPTEPTKTQNNETNPSQNPIDAPAMTNSATPANPPGPFSPGPTFQCDKLLPCV